MKEEKYWLLIAKKITGEATAEELLQLEELLHNNEEWQANMESLQEFWNSVPVNTNPVPQGRAVLERVRETGLLASTDTMNVSQIRQGFIVIAPVFRASETAGYLVGLYRLDRLLDVLSTATRENYRFRVWEGSSLIFESEKAPWPEGGGLAIRR